MDVVKDQVPGEDFVFVDAVFGMRPEQVGLQEEEEKEKTEKQHCFCYSKILCLMLKKYG